MWNLLTALKLIRETQETAKSYGYHICLGGGVLNTGRSSKDLDIYFLPLMGVGNDTDGLVASLEIGWGPSEGTAFSGGNKEGPYSIKLRFEGNKPTDAFQGRVEVFII